MPEMVILGAVVTPKEADAFRSAVAPYGADQALHGIIRAVNDGSLKLTFTDQDREAPYEPNQSD